MRRIPFIYTSEYGLEECETYWHGEHLWRNKDKYSKYVAESVELPEWQTEYSAMRNYHVLSDYAVAQGMIRIILRVGKECLVVYSKDYYTPDKLGNELAELWQYLYDEVINVIEKDEWVWTGV